MGSRAIIIICRDEDIVKKRFGIIDYGIGIVYTRTGRRFFNSKELEQDLLSRLKKAMDKCNFWEEFDTDWACLDCELMPWSAKAQELLRTQYAAVEAASVASIDDSIMVLEQTTLRNDIVKHFEVPENSSTKPADINQVLGWYKERKSMVDKYSLAYTQYCWPVESLEDYKLAPFHLLATENNVHIDKDHVWHMETLKNICEKDQDILFATSYKQIDLTASNSEKTGEEWWLELTEKGGEGMVVKPFDFITRGKRGLVQPAVKVRGREYLRIIYGPEYTAPQHMERLKSRGLGAKRSLALREFALGVEAIERFVRKEPLRRVHECVFGILALESEPVDPRL